MMCHHVLARYIVLELAGNCGIFLVLQKGVNQPWLKVIASCLMPKRLFTLNEFISYDNPFNLAA